MTDQNQLPPGNVDVDDQVRPDRQVIDIHQAYTEHQFKSWLISLGIMLLVPVIFHLCGAPAWLVVLAILACAVFLFYVNDLTHFWREPPELSPSQPADDVDGQQLPPEGDDAPQVSIGHYKQPRYDDASSEEIRSLFWLHDSLDDQYRSLASQVRSLKRQVRRLSWALGLAFVFALLVLLLWLS